MDRWKIDYFTSSSGRVPVEDFIENLPVKSQAKVFNTLELLADLV